MLVKCPLEDCFKCLVLKWGRIIDCILVRVIPSNGLDGDLSVCVGYSQTED